MMMDIKKSFTNVKYYNNFDTIEGVIIHAYF